MLSVGCCALRGVTIAARSPANNTPVARFRNLIDGPSGLVGRPFQGRRRGPERPAPRRYVLRLVSTRRRLAGYFRLRFTQPLPVGDELLEVLVPLEERHADPDVRHLVDR